MTSDAPGPEPIVPDAGPLIQLSRLGYVGLLPRLYQAVLLTPAVRRELRQGRGLPGSDVPDLPWVKGHAPSRAFFQRVDQELSAGAGEKEVLALGLELGATVALDDLKARRYAQQLDLDLTGTLGLLLEVHGKGWATRLPEEELDLLEQGGMRLAPALRTRMLAALLLHRND
jgi:uncharacterized protein